MGEKSQMVIVEGKMINDGISEMVFEKGSGEIEKKKRVKMVRMKRKGKKKVGDEIQEEGLVEGPVTCMRGEREWYRMIEEELKVSKHKGGGGWPKIATKGL